MIYLWIPVVMILGGIGRRIAGGVLNQWAGLAGGDNARVMGDLPARLIFAAAVAFSGFLGGAPWPLALTLIPAVWVGTTTGNFDSMGMGRGPSSLGHDLLGMSAHAALSAAAPVLVALSFLVFPSLPPTAWWLLAGLTLTAAPLYLVGWMLAGKFENRSFPNGLRGGSELGELFWGAACALGTFMCWAG